MDLPAAKKRASMRADILTSLDKFYSENKTKHPESKDMSVGQEVRLNSRAGRESYDVVSFLCKFVGDSDARTTQMMQSQIVGEFLSRYFV